nr:hypothetical protein [Kofleriaceae bacterium]
MKAFALAVGVVAVAAPGPARANPASFVPTAGGANLELDYQYELDRSSVEREHLGTTEKDLVFHQFQHTLTPRADVGIARDTWLSVSLPIVIAQARQLEYDSGVTAATSSSVADHILPPTGLDADNPGSPLDAPLAFKSATRHGLDQIWMGFGVAPMNERRDDTKPTWKLGADVGIAVGKVATLTDATLGSATGVGRGVDELRLWTSFDRRDGRLERYATIFWLVPFAATSHSMFQDPGFGATNVLPGQRAGANFGLELAAVDDAAEKNHIAIDLGERIVGHFEGRDYSEMWEAFAAAGDPATPGNPLVLDKDPVTPGVQALAHPGVTNIEGYLEVATSLAVRAELGNNVRFALSFDAIYKTDHAISFENAGIDRNGNGIIDPGSSEVNPLSVNQIDLVGHRYISTHNLGLVIGVQGQATF